MSETNTHVILQNRPSGWVEENDFTLRTRALPEVGAGDVLVRNIYISVDPYMRGRMNAGPSYAASFAIGEVVRARRRPGGAVEQPGFRRR